MNEYFSRQIRELARGLTIVSSLVGTGIPAAYSSPVDESAVSVPVPEHEYINVSILGGERSSGADANIFRGRDRGFMYGIGFEDVSGHKSGMLHAGVFAGNEGVSGVKAYADLEAGTKMDNGPSHDNVSAGIIAGLRIGDGPGIGITVKGTDYLKNELPDNVSAGVSVSF